MSNSDGNDYAGFSMLDLFRQEVEQHSAALSDGLLAVEQGRATAENLESLMRAAHSIKGAARIVQLDPVVTVAHAMEDCFLAAQEGRLTMAPDHVDTLLKGVDMIGTIAGLGEEGLAGQLDEYRRRSAQLVAEISAIRSSGGKGQDKKPPAKRSRAKKQVAPPPSPAPGGEVPAAATPSATEGGPVTTADDTSQPGTDAITRVVRVTAENLDRLMGLAGECVVETGWLHSFADSLLRLKHFHTKVADLLDKLGGCLELLDQTHASREYIGKARERMDEARVVLSESHNDFELFSRRLEGLTEQLYREVIASRMRPFADAVQGFPRMVRDLARELGKEVRLVVVGKATEVDRDILDKLEAPLNHLLRNALDHGVEMHEERAATAKPREATIRIEAKHLAGMLAITVSDDGRGINLDVLREKIVAKKIANPEMIARLNESELLDFLFLPAFSTRDEVTEISGRGVGLDVVQNMVHQVGGMVRVSTRPGQGTTVHMQLPITLSVLRTLLVEICHEPYALPLARVDRVLKLRKEDVKVLEDRQYCMLESENVGLISAHQVLELPAHDPHDDVLSVLVLSDRVHRYGLVVDRFLGERDLAVRPLDPRLGKVRDISAATLMENGTPVLILDVDDLVLSMDNLLSGGRLRKVTSDTVEQPVAVRKRVLVVDDSITVREVERKLLENRGYEVDVAVDGMEGWNAVRAGHYDLVISDVDMPRMNGIEFVTRIKHDERLRTMPVMIVSYKDREEDRMAGLEAGANTYLNKSGFHDETLVRAVIDLIGKA